MRFRIASRGGQSTVTLTRARAVSFFPFPFRLMTFEVDLVQGDAKKKTREVRALLIEMVKRGVCLCRRRFVLWGERRLSSWGLVSPLLAFDSSYLSPQTHSSLPSPTTLSHSRAYSRFRINA